MITQWEDEEEEQIEEGEQAAESPAEEGPQKSPEEEAQIRIDGLLAEIDKVEKAIRILDGQIANRNPALAKAIKIENKTLSDRVTKLSTAVYGLMLDSLKPRNSKDVNIQLEALRGASIEYFQNAGIDPDIWKRIES